MKIETMKIFNELREIHKAYGKRLDKVEIAIERLMKLREKLISQESDRIAESAKAIHIAHAKKDFESLEYLVKTLNEEVLKPDTDFSIIRHLNERIENALKYRRDEFSKNKR